jgi:hypothetical protein
MTKQPTGCCKRRCRRIRGTTRPAGQHVRQLLPHVLAITDPARDAHPDNPTVPWLLDRAATYLMTRGEPQPAQALFERAHQQYRDMLGEDHPDTLRSATNLAADLRALGEHEQARKLEEWIKSQYRP